MLLLEKVLKNQAQVNAEIWSLNKDDRSYHFQNIKVCSWSLSHLLQLFESFRKVEAMSENVFKFLFISSVETICQLKK